MPSTYPTTLDALSTGFVGASSMLGVHAQHHDDLADAVNKIEAALGINPFSRALVDTVDNTTSLSPTTPAFAISTANILKTNTATPFTLTHVGYYAALNVGSSSVSPVGTATAFTGGVAVTKSGNASNEHSFLAGWLRYDATVTPGRAWFTDFGLHGAIATQQDLLTGINMILNNYYNGSPISGPSSAMHVVSRPGTGIGADAAHQAATTYPVDVGIGVSGKSGVPATALTRGFTTAIKVGGTGGGWGAGFGSLFGTGIDVSDWETAGVNVSGRASTATGSSFATTTLLSTNLAFSASVTGDTNPRFTALASGLLAWGSGSAPAAVTLGADGTHGVVLTGDMRSTAHARFQGAGTIVGPSAAEVGWDGVQAFFVGYNRDGSVNVPVKVEGTTVKLTSSGTDRVLVGGTGIGFFGHAETAKPTVSGAKGSNAALGSLMTALSNLGLVTDSTSA